MTVKTILGNQTAKIGDILPLTAKVVERVIKNM